MYMTVKQAAEKWGISDRRVRILCAEGKISGVIHEGRRWMIPAETGKPADGREDFIDGNGRTGRLLVNLELMKAGYPPIDIKFADRVSYYDAFDEYYVKHNPGAMEKLFAGYVNARLDSYLMMLGK